MTLERYASFDDDGVCSVIYDCKSSAIPLGTAVVEIPVDVTPQDIWWDGKGVRTATPADLPIPAVMEVGASALTLRLPAGVVADVNGVRHRGVISLDPAEAGTIYVEVLGAQTGSYLIEVRSYAEQREASYAPESEQLDALWKIVQTILPHLPSEAVEALPADAVAVMDQISAVKAEFPKPGPVLSEPVASLALP